MRQIDPEKKKRVDQAILDIVFREGLAALSYGKIAKLAGVSSGTPYVYYKDRQEMLMGVFRSCRSLVDEGMDTSYDPGTSVQEQLNNLVTYLAHQFVRYPKEGKFIRAMVSNPELSGYAVGEEDRTDVNLLKDVIRRGAEQNCLSSEDPAVVYAVLISPMVSIVNKYQQRGKEVDLQELDEVIRVSVRAVIKGE